METSIPKGKVSWVLYTTSIWTREVKGKANISKSGSPEVASMISVGRTVSPHSNQAFGDLMSESDMASSKTTWSADLT